MSPLVCSGLPARLNTAIRLLLLLLLVGCSVSDEYNYAHKGVGTEIYRPGAARQYQLQELYYGYLCGTGGLPVSGTGGEGLPRCDFAGFAGRDWNQMVQAGLNDIDQRCDSYLAWHDNRKRSAAALTGQLNTTSQFVQAIIGIYEPTALAIRVVSHAFGFAMESLDNYDKRLVFQIDSSTLQSLVLKRQQDFRLGLRQERVAFNGKPSVEHALRSYLRICMPMTIETEINSVLTVFDRTGQAPDDIVTPKTSLAATGFEPRRAEQPATERPRRARIEQSDEVRKIFAVGNFNERDLIALQDALCVPEAEKGQVGARTRAKLDIAENYMQTLRGFTVDGMIGDRREFDRLTRSGACSRGTYRNVFEREDLSESDRIQSLYEAMELRKVPELQLPATFDLPLMRDNIARANRHFGISLPMGAEPDEVTPQLKEAMGLQVRPPAP